MSFFLFSVWGGIWRGIGCVVQQYWKYLKLPELYFCRQENSQCNVKSGYMVLDNPEQVWKWSLAAYQRYCFIYQYLFDQIKMWNLLWLQNRYFLDQCLWERLVHMSWFVKQHLLFCIEYVTVPTSMLMAVIVKRWKTFISVQCKN